MSGRTKSELMFEELCAQCEFDVRRIPESDREGERTPDYELKIGANRIIVEVKQFDPNPEELEADEALLRGEVVCSGTTPGKRIRQAIKNAAPQLRKRFGATTSTLLVVYNNVLSMRAHTDPYAIATGMHGLDVVPVSVPRDFQGKPRFGAVRSGPKRMMTENDNTSVSAVAVLYDNEGVPGLMVFHNRHSKHPLDPEWLRHSKVSQSRLRDGAASSVESWELV